MLLARRGRTHGEWQEGGARSVVYAAAKRQGQASTSARATGFGG